MSILILNNHMNALIEFRIKKKDYYLESLNCNSQIKRMHRYQSLQMENCNDIKSIIVKKLN